MKKRIFGIIAIIAAIAFVGFACGSSSDDETIYNIGDTGPGGGIVFYDKGDNTGGWRYLEAAPADVSGTQRWCKGAFESIRVNTSDGIGTGKANTAEILKIDENAPASLACVGYRGPKNLNDWFLPSKEELNLMFENLDGLTVFETDFYWSSSQHPAFDNTDDYWYAWVQWSTIMPSVQVEVGKTNDYYVRAIRAF